MLPDNTQNLDVVERRDERRHAVLVRANIEVPGNPPLNGHAVDISRGGMGLQCGFPLIVGTELNVTVAMEIFGETRSVILPGRVCYCKKQSDNHYRAGLQFVHMDDGTQAFVNALCP